MSQFIVNIVPLQNIQTNVSGLDATTVLSGEIEAIKKIVNPTLNKIYTDTIASYTTGGTINVVSPLNLSNVSLTSNLTTTMGDTSATTSNLTNSNSALTMYATNGSLSTVLTIATRSLTSAITVSEGGNLSVTGSGTFGGICYATQFVTLSDMMAKTGVREWRSPVLADLQKIHPYIFKYEGSIQEDIGLMAQEVGAIWPQLIKEGVKGEYVNYDGMLAILLKAVQERSARVSTLESR